MSAAPSRLVVVSNRVAANDGKAAAGGLAVALREALGSSGGVWFGWSGRISDSLADQPSLVERDGINFATIDLTEEDYETFYKGYANRTLWPLFHYRVDLTTFDRAFQDGYMAVNAKFAAGLAPLLKPNDLVWVHDYHLIPVGRELRRLGASQKLGFFLHIPWPTAELLSTLPCHGEMVQAMFCYDLVGFQAPSDLRAFRDYVEHEAGGRVLPDGRLFAFGRTLRAEVFPIGIDADEFAALAQTAEANRQKERLLRTLPPGGEIIIGVDRLDYSKGLPERFAAFEQLLTAYPQHRGCVSLLQIAPPSRSDVPEYVEIRHQLEQSAGRINGRFAEVDWTPIRYLNRPFGRGVLAALYRASTVGLVTPFRDGMNLVAKEYVAAQDPTNPGVLVLSRFAGAAQQLDGALIVNPYDLSGTADSIQQALKMELPERKERWTAMMEILRREDISHWRTSFVERLAAQEQPAPVTAIRPVEPGGGWRPPHARKLEAVTRG